MEQDDIFKLLLILLLISNEQENCTQECPGRYANLNELIIVFLLMEAFRNPSTAQPVLPLLPPLQTSF